MIRLRRLPPLLIRTNGTEVATGITSATKSAATTVLLMTTNFFSTFLSLTSDTGSDHGPPVSTTVLTQMDREHLASRIRRRRSYGKLFVTGRFFAWDKDKKKRVAAKRKTFETEAVTHRRPLKLSLYLVLLCFWRFLLFWVATAVVLVVLVVPMVVAVLFVLVVVVLVLVLVLVLVVLVLLLLLVVLVLLLLLVVLVVVAAMPLVLVEHVSSWVTGMRADFEKPEIQETELFLSKT